MSGFFIFPKNNSVCLRPDSSAVGRFFVVTGEIRPIAISKKSKTLKKIFVLNMSQAEIAREEGVSEQAISDRVSRIYNQLRKVLKKN